MNVVANESSPSSKYQRKNKKSLKDCWHSFKAFFFSRILPLNLIDRYLMWKFLSTYLFVILIIISIAVVFDINENIDKFVSRNATMRQIFLDYYLNFVPYYSNLFSQLFVFVSVIYFTTKLAENSEIIAMMSTGMTFRRLLRPYILSSVIIALISYYLGCYIIPEGNIKRVKFENTFKKRRTPAYTTNVQLEVDKGVIAYIGRYEDNTKTGYDFFLDKFKNKKLVSHLQSSTIRYDTLSEEPYHWVLSNYQTRELQGMREMLTSGSRLDTIIKMEPQDFLITKGQQETLTTPKLRNYIERQKARGFANIKEFEFEYWKRGASSFAIIILTIMGASLSARKRKNGMGIALGIGIILSLLYILFQTFSKTFAVNLNMHPAFAAWLPNLVFSVIAFILYKKAPR
jgi:lipopolysaccharide export system permease protein